MYVGCGIPKLFAGFETLFEAEVGSRVLIIVLRASGSGLSLFRKMGGEPPVEGTTEAVLQGDKIKSFTATLKLPEAPRSS